MSIRKMLATLSLVLMSGSAFAFQCPNGYEEAAEDANVVQLVQSQQAYLDFENDFVIPAGQSRVWLRKTSIVDQQGVTLANRKVKGNALRKILSYDWGHTPDMSYFLYTDRLRVNFEGSKYYRTYGDLLDRSGGQVHICIGGNGEEEI